MEKSSAALTEKLLAGEDLDAAEVEAAMMAMLDGAWEHMQTSAFLTALRAKGETPTELAAAAAIMVKRCERVAAANPASLLDTAGTGGDGQATFNISTAAAFTAAACGVPVAKHGNRNLSGKCGSSDLLAGLGASLDLEAPRIAEILEQTGICFMFAPAHHPALKAVAPVRTGLGIRTIFNLLGALANPAGAGLRLAGVFSPHWLLPYAEALRAAGATRAVVVHADGMDEFSVEGASQYVTTFGAEPPQEHRIIPEEAGVESHSIESLRIGSVEQAVAMFNEAIDAKPGAALEACVLNAGAALFAAGSEQDIAAGAAAARAALVEGRVRAKVDEFIAATNQA